MSNLGDVSKAIARNGLKSFIVCVLTYVVSLLVLLIVPKEERPSDLWLSAMVVFAVFGFPVLTTILTGDELSKVTKVTNMRRVLIAVIVVAVMVGGASGAIVLLKIIAK